MIARIWHGRTKAAVRTRISTISSGLAFPPTERPLAIEELGIYAG
jgi:hypothetical protein